MTTSSSPPSSSQQRGPDLYVKDTTTTYEPVVRDPSGFSIVSPDDHLIIDNGEHIDVLLHY